ncbi:nucleoside hydrolase [Sinomonas sp. ASV322]|uniref:nucleoside hydrolase n=1 Tax=Sinomonas sp. ASV322 TaxID=3041920 RepID=UPI0027DB05B3|nr:nucleoside hydrolase [Sinomonas sp. ASV322]MDQ4504571.1 nucleoside hydrolase [Sinomonas sp. ASV322]
MTRPVVISCDPGVDDAVALALAFASPELDVLAVAATAGNVSVETSSANAAALLDLFGAPAELAVHSGASGPLRGERVPDEPVHGAGGLGGVRLPPSSRRIEHDAVEHLARTILGRPGEVTLVALGPLTDVARLFAEHPRTVGALDRLVIMGGAVFAQGNVTLAAEFNFFADPEAAAAVLGAARPIELVPLDVTREAVIDRATAAGLAELPTPAGTVGRMLVGMCDAMAARGRPDVAVMHDALAVAAVLDPGLVEWADAAATVEVDGTLTRGAVVADVRGVSGRAANVRYGTAVASERFMHLLVERVTAL